MQHSRKRRFGEEEQEAERLWRRVQEHDAQLAAMRATARAVNAQRDAALARLRELGFTLPAPAVYNPATGSVSLLQK